MRRRSTLLLLPLLLCAAAARADGDAPAAPRVEPGRVLVRLAPAPSRALEEAPSPGLGAGAGAGTRLAAPSPFSSLPAAIRVTRSRALFAHAAERGAAAALRSESPGAADWRRNVFAVDFASDLPLDAVLAAFRALPGVEHAQPSYVYTPDLTPSDPQLAIQYAHALTDAEGGWDLETGDPSVVIAVLGTGIQLDHPDLAANLWQNTGEVPGNGIDDDGNGFTDDRFGWDFVGGDGDPSPDSAIGASHDTEVAGVAAAVADNGLGIAGVSWHSRLMALRIAYLTEDVAAAIDYAAANGAAVINMSFGNYESSKYGPDTIVEDAVKDAAAAGVVLVSTAGNDALSVLRYPAALDEVISVAATDAADKRALFSNYGTWIDVAAPGVGIQTTTTGGAYTAVSGTSYAAPYVSGLAALLLSRSPGLSPASVRDRIRYSVDKVATDAPVGTGRVNVARALALDADPDLFALIEAPRTDVHFGTEVVVEGIALGDAYSISYRADGESAWTPFAVSAGPRNGTLGVLDATRLAPGPYALRLRARRGAELDEHVISGLAVGSENLLPGWPQRAGSFAFLSPTFADLDGDGTLEVIAATELVQAWHGDGSPVAGWPVVSERQSEGAPSVGDIDGDGDPEVLTFGYFSLLSAWHHDGTPVAGFPRRVGNGDNSRSAAVLGDLDRNGALDVVVTTYSGANQASVRAFSGDGNPLPGWPVPIAGGSLQSSPTLGDLDGDGALEVVAHGDAQLYAFHADGSAVAGWPVALPGSHISPITLDLDGDGDAEVLAFGRTRIQIYGGSGALLDSLVFSPSPYGHPAVGDVDGDGALEVCIGRSAQVHLISFATGGERPGWPKSVEGQASCSIADVDGDGLQEILVGSRAGKLYAYHADGSLFAPGFWPKLLGSSVYGQPTLGDLEGDGSLEMGVMASQGEAWVFRFDGAAGGAPAQWPTYQANARHTGEYLLPEPAPLASLVAGVALLLALAATRRPAPG